MKNKKALCERTGVMVKISEGAFVFSTCNGEVSFVSVDLPKLGDDYLIPVTSFIRTPVEFIDWMAHLHEKPWFKADKFFNFFTRFRKANNLSLE